METIVRAPLVIVIPVAVVLALIPFVWWAIARVIDRRHKEPPPSDGGDGGGY